MKKKKKAKRNSVWCVEEKSVGGKKWHPAFREWRLTRRQARLLAAQQTPGYRYRVTRYESTR